MQGIDDTLSATNLNTVAGSTTSLTVEGDKCHSKTVLPSEENKLPVENIAVK